MNLVVCEDGDYKSRICNYARELVDNKKYDQIAALIGHYDALIKEKYTEIKFPDGVPFWEVAFLPEELI